MPKSSTKPHRTQFFASVLETLMERNDVNQVQLAASTGIAVSRVNNYLHGKYRTIRPDRLGVLAKGAARLRRRGQGLEGRSHEQEGRRDMEQMKNVVFARIHGDRAMLRLS